MEGVRNSEIESTTSFIASFTPIEITKVVGISLAIFAVIAVGVVIYKKLNVLQATLEKLEKAVQDINKHTYSNFLRNERKIFCPGPVDFSKQISISH